jgi:hypothetical protein
MATVHYGRLDGPVGFSRTVAIKRMHPHLAAMPALADAFVDEARLAARVKHPNVVPTIDVLHEDGEVLLVIVKNAFRRRSRPASCVALSTACTPHTKPASSIATFRHRTS